MKNLFKLSAAALCAIAFAACEPDNSATDNGQEGAGTDELVIPSVYFVGQYFGNYNENDLANVGVAFVEGEIGYDEWGDITGGNGTTVYIDLTMPLASDPDHALVAPGTYTMDADEEYILNTWSAADSYINKVENGNTVYDYAAFTGGTVTVSKDGDNYKFVLDMTIGEDVFKYEYTGRAKLINSSEEGQFSNLDRDVEVKNLSQASMFLIGDIMEDGATETWAISIGDEYYDLVTDWGMGYSMLLYFNLQPGLEGVPSGTYDTVLDVMDLMYGEADMTPNTLLGGFSSLGMYMGCYYMCPALTEEAALKSGSVTVVANGDTYKVSGKLYDGFGNEVSFNYDGEMVLMTYEEYALKSGAASQPKGFVAKKPFDFKRR